MIGQTLLHYRITDRLGAGGMGEVYRATDTNLDRDVAIKVLPPEVAGDPERLGRFRREAQLLAALNHTNIASIHGLEEADGQPFLVLELVEGEDLKERLDKGPIPLDDALEIARQIAEALEEAHAHGIVHRDLKPANVKLAPDGKVKVLDFGLAKAWADDGTSGTSSLDLSASPTLARSGTLAGVILGTAAYMSPEQAAGKAVDKRADIWSFGVVLFEMLTSQSLFTGETASEILASVIKEEPDWERMPEGCPPAAVRLLHRCLRKKPRERLQDVGDARLELEDALSGVAENTGRDEAGTPTQGEHRARVQSRVAWAVALILGGLSLFLAWRDLARTPEARRVARLGVDVPRELALRDARPAVSPDGRHLALAVRGVDSRLWVRSLETGETQPLAGTEGAWGPFWSPDGADIGFLCLETSGVIVLKRTGFPAGGVQTICSVPGTNSGSAAWSGEGRIIFAAGDFGGVRIYSVSSAGGEPRVVLEPDGAAGELGYWWPQFLPDGNRILFGVSSPSWEGLATWVSSLDVPHEKRLVLPGVFAAQLSSTGHLLYIRDGNLVAHPFDTGRAELTGEPIALASSVATFSGWASARIGLFSASDSGTLIYIEEGDVGRELTWFDRDGTRRATIGESARFGQFQLSPDGRRVATEIESDASSFDIWTLDIDREVLTRVTSAPGMDINPVWAPDGRELFFDSNRDDGVSRLYRKPLDGGSESVLLKTSENAWTESVTPDGETLIYLTGTSPNDSVWALPLRGGGEPELVMKVDYALEEPQVSPDGRWLAYSADVTDEWEVYVTPFRRPGPKIRVSPGGGRQPRWRGDGRELFYVTARGELIAVEVREIDGRLEVGRPSRLFDAGVSNPTQDEYSVTKDGQRFLVVTPVEESGWSLKAILSWPELLE